MTDEDLDKLLIGEREATKNFFYVYVFEHFKRWVFCCRNCKNFSTCVFQQGLLMQCEFTDSLMTHLAKGEKIPVVPSCFERND